MNGSHSESADRDYTIRELAGMSLWKFRQVLASRRIPPHYEENDLAEDVQTLRELGRL